MEPRNKRNILYIFFLSLNYYYSKTVAYPHLCTLVSAPPQSTLVLITSASTLASKLANWITEAQNVTANRHLPRVVNQPDYFREWISLHVFILFNINVCLWFCFLLLWGKHRKDFEISSLSCSPIRSLCVCVILLHGSALEIFLGPHFFFSGIWHFLSI